VGEVDEEPEAVVLAREVRWEQLPQLVSVCVSSSFSNSWDSMVVGVVAEERAHAVPVLELEFVFSLVWTFSFSFSLGCEGPVREVEEEMLVLAWEQWPPLMEVVEVVVE